MVRLRYKKMKDGTLFSDQLLVGDKLGYVCIIPGQLEFCIYDIDSKVLWHGSSTNLPDLKKKAKAALKTLGVEFLDEVRNRGSTEKLNLDKL